MTEPAQHTVVVVGAGVAGLRTALDLHRRGVDVLVLEAAPRVGGRTLTESTPLGSHVDLGGQWIGKGHHRFFALAAEYGAHTYQMTSPAMPRLVDGANTVRWGGPTTLLTGAVLAALEAGHRVEGLLPRRSSPRPTTVGELLRRVPGPARRLLHTVLAISTTADPDRMGLRDYAQILRAQHGLIPALTSKGGAQDTLVVEGAGSLAERMAAELGDRVQLGRAVTAIHRDADGADVHTASGTVRARRVVVTAPPPTAARIEHRPPLPAARAHAESTMYMGLVYKALAVYERPFWRERGPAEMIDIADPGVGVFDSSPPSADGAGPGHLCMLIGGPAARAMDALPEAERREALLTRLAEHLGDGVRTPVSWHDKSWHLDEFAGGGYLALPDAAAGGTPCPVEAAPSGTVHWAGTETATDHPGYIEGALQSGERAAREVAEALGALAQ